ncbi:hypothetical protein CDD83_6923 [Cordyceps sp. RAO-2017]|nr:hypothetical protein CDD83_6923 [Cordyceps sp. RAO-2017]
MSGNSSVGTRSLYEAGDQRNVKRSEMETAERFEEGKPGSHLANDSKDQRSIANRLAAEERKSEPSDDKETAMSKKDPTLPARAHGNEPSKGAKIDAEIQAEEEEMLRRKDSTQLRSDNTPSTNGQTSVTMGEALIEGSNWRLVEVGRVVLIEGDHPFAGCLATIVEIVDHKRVLVDGPSSDRELAVPRQSVPLSKCLLSQFTIEGLLRGSRHGTVKKLWEKAEIDAKWKASNWAKKRDQIKRRKNLTDFDRFKVMRLKKQRRFEERKALAKIKAAA